MVTSNRMIALLILSCSVAADATAVAIAASIRGITFRQGAALSVAFGAAQSIMAAIGWMGGAAVGEVWSAWDHWIALVLLSIVGIKMIKEAFDEDDERPPVIRGLQSLLMLSVATSIDALAVGVSLPALGSPPILSLAMIGLITWMFSAAGAVFGRYVGERFGRTMEIGGGAALIALGIKIAFEHTR